MRLEWERRIRAVFPRTIALIGILVVFAIVAWVNFIAKAKDWPAELNQAASLAHDHPQSPVRVLVLVGILVVIVLWRVPKAQAARSQGSTPQNSFDRENEARKTLAQIIGGFLVLAGLYSSLQTFNLQQNTFDLQRAGQITDRFSKAIDQLGAVETGADGKPRINLEARIGGIYALE